MADEPAWWLSFCDPERPEGQQFIGVVIARGWTIQAAVTETHLRGVNPGGEISFAQIPDEHIPLPEFQWVLLSYADLSQAGLLE